MKLLNHGWQSKPNPNQTTATVCYHQVEQSHGEEGGPRREKQKAKRILGPALFLQGYSHHLQGDKERFNSCQDITGGFPRGYFMGWHKPTPSVTCRWTCQAGLIRSETQRAIASLDNTAIALRVHNSRPKTETAERPLNWILSLAGPWQWFTCNRGKGWEPDSA